MKTRSFTFVELSTTERQGFTLIELLVVVTIIVVLLALLVPAMDQAIYQAELAVCATQLKAIATGSTVYAAENKRFYPHRYWRMAGDGRANAISYPGWGDDRPIFNAFISLKTFVDPLVDDIRIDAGSGSGTETYVYITRTVWAGWKYANSGGMVKLGDRLSHKDLQDTAKTNRFDILAADLDQIKNDLSEIHSAHPDVEGRLQLWTARDDLSTPLHWFSEWFSPDRGRGNVDAFNYAHADASVSRLNDVELSHGQNLPGDERLRGLNINHTGQTDYYFFLPAVQ